MQLKARPVFLVVILFASAVLACPQQPAELHPGSPTVGTAGVAGTAPSDGDRPELRHRYQRYIVSRSDTIAISFPLSPEFNQTVTVQPDGFASLIGVGDVHVEGLTLPEIKETIRTAYRNVLHDPIIAVDLKDFQKPSFTALGEVSKPGKYELREDTTVAQAVAVAGGFLPTAKHSQVILFRRVSKDWTEVKAIDLKHMLNARNLSEDIHLEPGDIIYVPHNFISKLREFLPGSNVTLGFYTPRL